jgi:ABC-type glycerol-3-phosphate transport system substrate-binding protein
VRGAYAAGKLTLGFWDHWVPGANKASTDLVNEWAAKEKVEVSIDYITGQGNKLILTAATEAQAKSGHDILAMATWRPHADADQLEPVNDIMDPIIKQNGEVNDTVKYLGQANGKWLGVPACIGSQIKGPCSRIDLMKKYANIDVQAIYPAGSPPKADTGRWTRSSRRQNPATRPVSPLASVSARPPTAWIPPARSSTRSAQNSSMPRVISPSRPMPSGRRSIFTRS